MIRRFAIAWVMLVVLAAGYVGLRVAEGLHFRTGITALLPRESRDAALEKASRSAIDALSQRLVILIGHPDRATAIATSRSIAHDLHASGTVALITNSFHADQMHAIGTLYFPYRHGLLSDADRALLAQGHGQRLANRAGAQVFGMMGMANGGLLRSDPFLLAPAFLTGLPNPMSRFTLQDGALTLTDNGTSWVLIAAQLKGDAYATDTQQRFMQAYDKALNQHQVQDLKTLRLGAMFFAQAGAQQAADETSTIGLVSTLGTVALILLIFCRITPLWLSLLVIAVGMVTALAASLLLFRELHVSTLLFGSSLIGVAVDYSLEYFSQIFATPDDAPRQRLKTVGMGIGLGTATTIIGYITFLLAPLPGLHQIAVFSAVGLAASWLTVVLWLPALDRSRPPRHRDTTLACAARLLSLWEAPRYRPLRYGVLALILLLSAIGLPRFHAHDDIRRMQSPSPELLAEQHAIERLMGSTHGNQFFVVQAATEEEALQQEEALAARLRPLVAAEHLKGFQMLSQYIPSAKRQHENRRLVTDALYTPHLAQQQRLLQLAQTEPPAGPQSPVLTLDAALAEGGPLPFLTTLRLAGDGATHLVMLDGIADLTPVAQAAEGLAGVHFVDPAGDFSSLLEKYRERMLVLIGAAALLIMPLLLWRYRLRGFLWVLLPPVLALLVTPALRSLAGGAFTFFDAMALVLVLSIGVDYAVFYAEASRQHRVVTLLSVSLSATTTLLSFGLLALSQTLAVQHFGSTMTVGILLAYLLAPIARRGGKNH